MNKLFVFASITVASIIGITGCGSSSSGGGSDGGKKSNPKKELVFDMSGQYDLANYLVLDGNGTKNFKETTKVNTDGVNNYTGIDGTAIYFTSDYARDGEDVTVTNRTKRNTVLLSTIEYGIFDTKIQRTPILAAGTSSYENRMVEIARHVDKKDIVVKSNSKYRLCKFSDTSEKMSVKEFEYSNIIIVNCDLENNTTLRQDGEEVIINYKGNETSYYAKNNALIKSVQEICKDTTMDGESLKKRCIQTTVEQMPY